MLDMTAATALADNPAPHLKSLGCGRYWAVAHTHPQSERWAADNVARLGYRVYLPLIRIKRRDPVLHTLFHSILVPLFRRYLFVRLGSDPWTPVRYAPGVKAILMLDGKPQLAPAGAVEALEAGEDARQAHPPDPAQTRPGDALRFVHGPFRGMDCLVLRVHGKHALVQAVGPAGMCKIDTRLEWLGARV